MNYEKSRPELLVCSALDPHHLYYTLSDNKIKNKCVYTVKYFPDQFCWKCNCSLICFTGLPCPHLIRVVLAHQGSLQYYVNERWIVTVPEQA